MRILLTLLIGILPMVSYSQSTSGLVAHWNLNNNTNDGSGNSLNGTPYNISYTTGSTGIANSAAVFNGVDGYIMTPYQSVLNINQYSICAVVKVNGYNTGYCQEAAIIASGLHGTTGSISLTMGDNPFDGDNCNYSDTGKHVFRSSAGSKGVSGAADWQYTPTIVSNRWYHVVATFDGNVYKIYVDGQLKNTATVTFGTFFGNTLPFAIGKNASGTGNTSFWFNGAIDDVKIYGRALDDSEIVANTYSHWINQPFTDTVLCGGNSFNLNYSTNKNYKPGNIFTAQLSNASGSFASPVNIGSLASQTSGTISCTIPTNTPTGTGYRIRILSSSPTTFSDDNGIDIRVTNNIPIAATIVASPSNAVGPYTPVTFTANVSGTATSYQWKKNGSNIAGATSATYIGVTSVDISNGDEISVAITGTSACAQDTVSSNKIKIFVNVGTSNVSKNEQVIISPNPSNGAFKLVGYISNEQSASIAIYNMIGQVVHQEDVLLNNGKLSNTIHLNNDLAQGSYLLKINSGKYKQTLPLLIK